MAQASAWDQFEVVDPVAQAAGAGPSLAGFDLIPMTPGDPTKPKRNAAELEGQELTNEEKRQALNTPKPVPGYEGWFFGPDGKPFKMEGLPPSDVDPQIKTAIKELGLDELLFSVGRAKGNLKSPWSTGTLGAIAEKTPLVSGTPRDDLLGNIESLTGAIIMEKLQALKELSKTGASGMGALSEREGARLAAAVSALSPEMSKAELATSLAVIERHARALKAIGDGLNPEDPAVARQYGIVPLDEIGGPIDPEGTGDIGFETPPQDPRGNPLTPEQQAAYTGFLGANPEATPEQLIQFVNTIGGGDLDPARAQEIIDFYKKTGRFAPGSEAVTKPPDINDVRSEDGGIGQSIEAGVRAATRVVPGADRLKAAVDAVASGDLTYDEALARQQAINAYDWQNHAIAATVGTIAGAAAIPTGVRQAARTAAIQVMRSGGGREAAVKAAREAATRRLAAEGGAYGATHGAMSGEGDLADRAAQAAVSGLAGVAAGGLLPSAAQAGGATAKAVGSIFAKTPELAKRVAYKAIRADGNTADDVGRMAAEANESGVPFMPADSGENARGLLAATARAPGAGRTKATEALDARQNALGERIVTHIERDLGPIANPHRVADEQMAQASATAGPLYEAAYARPGVDAFVMKVRPLLNRPAMTKALENARKIVLEEGGDPNALGFDFNEAGDVILTKVPSWRTLDYVKRGMDDVLEAFRDPTTQRLNLNTQGNAINNTRKQFLAAFDAANPDYAAARAAYAGPVKGVGAMNQGRKALSLTADDLEERMRGMTPFERDMYALGARRAMAELVESKGDTANVVSALVGTGKKRAMLGRLFGGRKEFERFVRTLEIEQEAFQTFKRARTGSPTAPNMADDSQLAVATGVGDLFTSGLPIISALRLAVRAKGRRSAEKAQQAIAEMLGETDPARVREIIRRFKHEEGRLASRRRRGLTVVGKLAVDPEAKTAVVPISAANAPSVDSDE